MIANAFAITFSDRLPARREPLTEGARRKDRRCVAGRCRVACFHAGSARVVDASGRRRGRHYNAGDLQLVRLERRTDRSAGCARVRRTGRCCQCGPGHRRSGSRSRRGGCGRVSSTVHRPSRPVQARRAADRRHARPTRRNPCRRSTRVGCHADARRTTSARSPAGLRRVQEAAKAFHALCEGLAALELRGFVSGEAAERQWRTALTALVAGFGSIAPRTRNSPPRSTTSTEKRRLGSH